MTFNRRRTYGLKSSRILHSCKATRDRECLEAQTQVSVSKPTAVTRPTSMQTFTPRPSSSSTSSKSNFKWSSKPPSNNKYHKGRPTHPLPQPLLTSPKKMLNLSLSSKNKRRPKWKSPLQLNNLN